MIVAAEVRRQVSAACGLRLITSAATMALVDMLQIKVSGITGW